jgi:hypothetical protein
MWRNVFESETPAGDNIIRRMRSACWITKAADTHSEYIILNCFSTITIIPRRRLNVKCIRTLPVLFCFSILWCTGNERHKGLCFYIITEMNTRCACTTDTNLIGAALGNITWIAGQQMSRKNYAALKFKFIFLSVTDRRNFSWNY